MYSDIGTTFWNLEEGMSSETWGDMGYERDERECPGDQTVNTCVVVRNVVAIKPWRAFRIKLLLNLRVSDATDDCHQSKQSEVDYTGND